MKAKRLRKNDKTLALSSSVASAPRQAVNVAKYQTSNLLYDSSARIQTGPAKPEWQWNQVRFHWTGPVTEQQRIHPVLITLQMQRFLTVLRVVLLIGLAALLFGVRRTWLPRAGKVALAALLLPLMTGQAIAELPDEQLLQTLRERLLEPSDAFPHAAEIPSVNLTIDGAKVTMFAEIHALEEVAVPVPGRLPSWSPVSLKVDGEDAVAVRRMGGFLWVVLSPGVHQVEMTGLLPESTEWEWSFKLKPRRVTINAPGWTVTGLGPNGVPESHIFLTRQQRGTAGEAAYDRKDFNVIVALERHFEVGLEWQLQNKVVRLSQTGKAVSLKIPLLAGEKVITPNTVIKNGFIEVALGVNDREYVWKSVLPRGKEISLRAAEGGQWIERWYLITSPVWNVSFTGLTMVFEPNEKDLIPVWHPWPGEGVDLTFSKPEAISGETITVKRVDHNITLGRRQQTIKLDLQLECSLGDDFVIGLTPQTEVITLKHNGKAIPVRRDDGKLIVPVRPGAQRLEIEYRIDRDMSFATPVDKVTLPVEGANARTSMHVPESRWALWAQGPLRGPAVRFWTVLVWAILAAWILGGIRQSPLKRFEWILLAIGLTQVHIALSVIVIGWLFLLVWRGRDQSLPPLLFNVLQLVLIVLTLAALGALFAVVGEGLLGDPAMFIRGNGSTASALRWFEPRPGVDLPQPVIFSVSIWVYRLLMLAWALWLATALIGWLKWAWLQFGRGGYWRKIKSKKNNLVPPVLPKSNEKK